MSDLLHREPWERLEELLDRNDADGLLAFLSVLPASETGRALSRLDQHQQAHIFELIGPEEAAATIERLTEAQATEILEELPAERAAAIIDELPSNEQADLLSELDEAEAEAILEEMEPEEATDARRLLQYAPRTAGGLMITEYLAFGDHLSIAEVVDDLRRFGDRYSDYDVQYAYITDDRGRLKGVLRIRDLLLSQPDAPVRSIMLRDPFHVLVDATVDDLKRTFDEHPFVGFPVTDRQDRLVGVVRRAAVEQALAQRATQTFLAVSGLFGAEEIRSMPVLTRAGRRLSWLSINIVLNVIAASVIAIYQDTLAAVIALAVFLPIISDMSGCSGNQAVAVSIRELALGLIKPYEFARVFVKEGAVGIINGIVLGALLGAVAFAWKGNVYLGLVVGAAMTLNTVNAVVLGGVIPLGLKALRFDPALAASPILTTVTDMVGFFLVLSFASAMLPLIVA